LVLLPDTPMDVGIGWLRKKLRCRAGATSEVGHVTISLGSPPCWNAGDAVEHMAVQQADERFIIASGRNCGARCPWLNKPHPAGQKTKTTVKLHQAANATDSSAITRRLNFNNPIVAV
jgi:hypothetical protein